MNQAALMKVGIALAACLAVAKFSPNAKVTAAAMGVAGVVIARQVPYLKDALV
jgi:hypothetical protein